MDDEPASVRERYGFMPAFDPKDPQRCGSPNWAQRMLLARRLVEQRLAACVHVSEVASTFRWNGRVAQETEFLVEARTLPGRRPDAVALAMLEGHPYEVPMVESIVTRVSPRYHKWMKGDLR